MHLKNQIESEQFPSTTEGGSSRYFRDLPKDEQQSKLKDRLKKYCQKVCWMLSLSFFNLVKSCAFTCGLRNALGTALLM